MKTILRKKMTWSFVMCFVLFSWIGSAQYNVDFEDDSKTSYASGTVTLSGIQWDMTDALIGADASDFKVGTKSARMRGYGSSALTMLENKTNGLGSISFDYRRYGTDSQVDWMVEYSTDSGSTWTQAGSDFTATSSNTVQTFSATVDVTGDVRIRVKRATESGSSNRRLNIDSLVLTDFVGAGLPSISTSVSSLPSFGDVNVGSNSASQSFTVSGANLTDDLLVSAPTNFQVSLDGSTFTDDLFIDNVGGTLGGEVTVFVRFSPSTAGLSTGVVTLLTEGDEKTVSVSGTGTAPAIDAPVAIAASDVTASSFTANWNSVPGATNYRLDVSTSPDFPDTILADDLFISEYVEGSSNNKYIELYNGTGAAVDLSDYELRLYPNGAGSPNNTDVLSGILNNGQTILFRNSGANLLGSNGITSAVCNFNGDDAIALFKISTNSFVDIFGRIGSDPGAAWNVGGNSTLDRTLVRNSNITGGITSNPASNFPSLGTEWTQFTIDTSTNLNNHIFDGGVISFVSGYEDLTVNGTSQIVTGLAEGVTYYYRVRAFDGTTSVNSNVISVTTLISPPTFTAILQDEVLCQDSEVAFTVSGLLAGSTSTISYTIDGGTTQTFSEVVADGLGNATVTLTLSAINNGQELVVTEVERTDLTTTTLNPSSGNAIELEVQLATLFYFDFDGDNYGDDNDFVLSCDAPFGYVSVGGDCNDANPAINPGATEICYDGIDQNCDGNTNDGCAVITATLRAENCGQSLTSLNQVVRGSLYSQAIPAGVTITGYRFKVTNLITLQERIVDRSNYVFQLTYTDFAEYNTPYSVEVALRLNQEWMTVYGAACTITTPGVPNTVLAPTSCGATLVQMNNIIRAVVVPSALNYEYNVALIENGIPVATTTLVRSGESFNLLQLTGIPIKFGAEYSVTIRVEVPTSAGAQWSAVAGAACSVFTPLVQEAAIEGCGSETGITPATLSTLIRATAIGGATNYRFTLTDGLSYTQVYTTPNRYFSLNNFNALSPLTAGGSYSVFVEVEVYGNYYEGKDCNILVPGGSGRPIEPITRTTVGSDNAMGEFKAVAYPNPFANNFAINLRSNNTSEVSLAIYDMTGRLLETRNIKADGLSSQTIGERYPAGVYNVIISQGENTQTIRVVKQ